MESPHDWPLIIWLFLAEAVGYVCLLWLSRGRRTAGIGAFRGVVCGATLFLLAESVILLVADPAVQFLLTCLSFASAGLIAPCVVLLFAARANWEWWTRPKIRRLLLAAGLLLSSLRVFDPWTGWVSHQTEETTSCWRGAHAIHYQPDWGFFAMLAMCIATAVFCLWATIRAWREASPLQRRQLTPMALACIPPLVSEVLFSLNPERLHYLDPTPGVLGFTVAMMSWAVLRSGFVKVAPFARAFLFENLGRAAVATDAERIIVDYNSTAGRELGWTDRSMAGQPLEQALHSRPALAEFCRRETEGRLEYQDATGHTRVWEATWHPLRGRRLAPHRGYLLQLADITEQKRREKELAKALADRTEEWTRATKAAISASEEEQRRIGRVLHDSVCQDLVGFVRTTESILAACSFGRQGEQLSALAGRMRQSGERARNIAHLLEGPDFEWTSFEDALEALLAQLETRFALVCDLTISPYFPSLGPEPARSFLYIVREAIVNASRHAQARRIWVDLTRAASAPMAVASIANDGTTLGPNLVEGLGLRQMRMRAALLGAQLMLEPGPSGQGACMRLLLPVPTVPDPSVPTS